MIKHPVTQHGPLTTPFILHPHGYLIKSHFDNQQFNYQLTHTTLKK